MCTCLLHKCTVKIRKSFCRYFSRGYSSCTGPSYAKHRAALTRCPLYIRQFNFRFNHIRLTCCCVLAFRANSLRRWCCEPIVQCNKSCDPVNPLELLHLRRYTSWQPTGYLEVIWCYMCKGLRVQLPLSSKFAVKKTHIRFPFACRPVCLC